MPPACLPYEISYNGAPKSLYKHLRSDKTLCLQLKNYLISTVFLRAILPVFYLFSFAVPKGEEGMAKCVSGKNLTLLINQI